MGITRRHAIKGLLGLAAAGLTGCAAGLKDAYYGRRYRRARTVCVRVVLADSRTVAEEYARITGGKSMTGAGLGFYDRVTGTAYSVFDERVLGHEILHALGYHHDVRGVWRNRPDREEGENAKE